LRWVFHNGEECMSDPRLKRLSQLRQRALEGGGAKRIAHEEDFSNFILMHALGANTAGQLGSVIAGGVLLALLGAG
jgi:hypothetical protein